MNIALVFVRTFFMILSIFFMTTYLVSNGFNYFLGLGAGVLLGLFLIGFDFLFRRFNLRAFNSVILGLFFGYLLGQALVIIFTSILDITSNSLQISKNVIEVIEISLFLFGLYLGTIMTIKASDELSICIPFIRFTPTSHKKKDLLIDSSILSDARIIDLASSGILDQQLTVPKFVVKEFLIQLETQNELMKSKAKKALETLKKLEALNNLELKYNETDFPDVKDPLNKLIRLARLTDSNILSADVSKASQSMIEGIKMINIHTLSTALKPLMQAGETIKVKIQRFGKEPRQGVGYLEDGTMVVVNGGGQYMGEFIEAKVLSVKHTTSGRIIFCNAKDEEGSFNTHYEEDQ